MINCSYTCEIKFIDLQCSRCHITIVWIQLHTSHSNRMTSCMALGQSKLFHSIRLYSAYLKIVIIIIICITLAHETFVKLSRHLLGGIHLFEPSSMIVPVGHSHPSVAQILGSTGLDKILLLAPIYTIAMLHNLLKPYR